MSELSAKHRALNVLQALTSESKSHSIKTSPRPDLSASQEILSSKYRELAALLATQHVERKTVSRLQSVDLVSSRLGDSQRSRCYHDNQEKASRRRQRRKVLAAQSVDRIPETELSSCLKARSETDSTEIEIDLLVTQNSLPDVKNKRVSFSGSRTQLNIDGYASSSTDVSDTEVIRRIFRSPRRVITEEANTSSPGKQKVSPRNKKTVTSKKKSRKQKRSQKQLSKDDRPAYENETLKLKELHLSDHKLNSSSNPDVLSWLRAKNKLIRKQKRAEKKKERLEQLAEHRVAETKSKKLVESEVKVTEWMKVKKVESLLQRRVEKKIQREKAQSPQRLVESSSDRAKSNTPQSSTTKTKSKSVSPRGQKPSSRSKESVAQKKDLVDDEHEQRHHLVRNLEAERLHAEEKRQAKDAERRRRRLLKEAQTTPDSKGPHPRPPVSKKLSSSDSKKVEKSISEASPENNQTAKSGVDKSKTRPSSNPLKGLTYEDWLKQKQTNQRKQAKEAKKQEVVDPELDDLIPLLARRRIEQIKIRATRVDSGLRRSKTPSSLESDRSEKQNSPNGERPYTWKPPSGDSSSKPDTKKSGGSTKRKTFTNSAAKENCSPKESDEINSRLTLSMPDVINFVERPEPQGCEGTQEFPCQSPKTNQSNKKNTDKINQSETTLGNSKVTSANGEAQIQPIVPDETFTSDETIFLTESESLKK